jgi:hypothetical protein
MSSHLLSYRYSSPDGEADEVRLLIDTSLVTFVGQVNAMEGYHVERIYSCTEISEPVPEDLRKLLEV